MLAHIKYLNPMLRLNQRKDPKSVKIGLLLLLLIGYANNKYIDIVHRGCHKLSVHCLKIKIYEQGGRGSKLIILNMII